MRRRTSTLRRGLVVGLLIAFPGAACGSGGGAIVENEPMLTRSIAGTSDGKVDVAGDRVTRLLEVTGDWNAVSVRIADAAIEEGWTIEGINCVGTGNDVIARKYVDGTWLLLESGAGTRGAGIIVSIAPDQRGPRTFSVSGRCPEALTRAATNP